MTTSTLNDTNGAASLLATTRRLFASILLGAAIVLALSAAAGGRAEAKTILRGPPVVAVAGAAAQGMGKPDHADEAVAFDPGALDGAEYGTAVVRPMVIEEADLSGLQTSEIDRVRRDLEDLVAEPAPNGRGGGEDGLEGAGGSVEAARLETDALHQGDAVRDGLGGCQPLRTAEHGVAGDAVRHRALQLIMHGVPQVLGWPDPTACSGAALCASLTCRTPDFATLRGSLSSTIPAA